jgi:HEAT repeat protein
MARSGQAWWLTVVGTVVVVGCSKGGGPAKPPAVAKPAASGAAVTAPAPTNPAEPAPAEAAPATPDLAALRRTLAETGDGRERVLTIDAIAALGQRGRDALPELLAATTDTDPRPRWHAARAVGLIGEDAVSALPTLVKLLGDPDPIVVTQAAAAIGMVRRDDGDVTAADAAAYESTVEPLVKATVHADARARRAAVRALRAVHSDPKQLAVLIGGALDDSDPSVVLPALQTLADMEDHAVPVLLEALKDPKSRYWAEVAIAEIGPEAAAAVPRLAELVAQGEPEEKLQSILALAEIGPPAAAAAPQLIEALASDERFLKAAAAFALGASRAAAADDALAKAEDDADAFLATTASWARAKIRPDDAARVEKAVERLRKALKADDPRMRKAAVSGLSDLAGGLDAALKQTLAVEFAELLDDQDAAVGMSAGAGLVRLREAAVDHLRGRLGEAAHRRQALGVLGAIGAAAKPALPELTAALADADETCATEAAVAIAEIGADASAAVPELQKLLADDAPAGTRYTAAYALGRIGSAAKAALPRLLELSTCDDEIMATVAVWSALKIEPSDAALVEKAIPLLRRALRGDRDMVRLEAAVSLGDIGKAATTSIPLLELVAEEDSVPAVRAAAAEALAKIRAQ